MAKRIENNDQVKFVEPERHITPMGLTIMVDYYFNMIIDDAEFTTRQKKC